MTKARISRTAVNAGRSHWARFDSMLKERPVYLNGSQEDDALQQMVRDLLTTDFLSAPPEIIFVGAAPENALLNALAKRLPSVRFRVHAVVVETEPSKRLEALSTDSGGIVKYASELDLRRTLRELYSSLVHRYELVWKRSGREVALQVDSKETRGGLVTDWEHLTIAS
jgi:hypothetical protein